jgi:hypothetical protein
VLCHLVGYCTAGSETYRFCVWSSANTGKTVILNSQVSPFVLWEHGYQGLEDFCTFFDDRDTLYGFQFENREEAIEMTNAFEVATKKVLIYLI